MCEVGTFLRQNFQPSRDPVIAEFELSIKLTVRMLKILDQNYC